VSSATTLLVLGMLEKEQNQECRLTHRENRAVRLK